MKYKLVLVEWVDSIVPHNRWEDLDAYPNDGEGALCQSVGWLVKDNEKIKVLSQSICTYTKGGDPETGLGFLTIPTVSVLRIKERTE